jgi:hypothetical protein
MTGWRREFGRSPDADDLLLPVTRPTNRGPRRAFMAVRDENCSWKQLRKDLGVLGFRLRRQHDLRRTGITLAREDGPERDIPDRRTTPSRSSRTTTSAERRCSPCEETVCRVPALCERQVQLVEPDNASEHDPRDVRGGLRHHATQKVRRDAVSDAR